MAVAAAALAFAGAGAVSAAVSAAALSAAATVNSWRCRAFEATDPSRDEKKEQHPCSPHLFDE